MVVNSRMRMSGEVLRLATGLAAAALLTGIAVVLGYSVGEAMANPGYSLRDGYWVGRQPWTGVSAELVVGGATAAIIAGAGSVLALGGWVRRIAVGPPLMLAGFWWLLAVGRVGTSGGACPDCLPTGLDGWAYAYSAPGLALALLVLPATVVVLLALARRAPPPGAG